jgi:sugar lactone lactonase YvrE
LPASFTLGGAPIDFAANINSSGLTIDVSGNFYSTDGINNLINKVSPAGVVTTLAGSGAAGSANGTGTAASFNNPQGIAVDGTGNIYVGDVGNNLIRKITSAGVVTTFAGSGAAGSANGTGTAASFNQPYGIAVDGAGNIYVADAGNYLIRKITPAGVVTTFAGSGTSASVDGTGAAASFSQPNSLAIDASGNLYVGDLFQVRIITPAGVVTTLAGSYTQDVGSADGNGAAATFNFAGNMAVDHLGNVYVAEIYNGDIRKITRTTVTTYSIISTSIAGGITIDASGNLYIWTGSGLIKIITTLPPGIVFNGSTGAISGTPTAISPPINYTVEAFDDGGSSVTTVSITVNNLAPVISYPQSPLTATVGVTFSISSVYTGGAPSSYTVNIPLPAGISLNGTTGAISGTPSAASPSTNYNITAHNNAGNNTTTVNITVKNPPPAPKISYAGPKTYTINTAIAPLSPSNTGGAVPPATMVSTFAGSGAFGAVNGPNLAASFSNLKE